MEAKLIYWEHRNECLRAANPDWRSKVPKGVAAVPPLNYHLDIPGKMLEIAGDSGAIVDQIMEGLHISGCNFSTGHYDLLPFPSVEELNDLKENFKKSMKNQRSEIIRLLSRRPGTDGQAEVREHTHKEHKLGKFELAERETQWRIYFKEDGTAFSNVPFD